MLSALLPGVREFRTPLVTGLLWVACLWVLVGFKVAESDSTGEFVRRFRVDDLPPVVWLGGGALLVYLVGSLLVVRTSPLRFVSAKGRPRIQAVVARLDDEREPKCRRHRVVWKLWRGDRLRRAKQLVRVLGADGERYQAVDAWLYNEFQSLSADGRVPVMRSFDGGCTAPTGFQAFYSTDSLKDHPAYSDSWELRSALSERFVDEVKAEQAAVEVRVQMRFPEVYSEIDRLKVEGELRLSIFWPLVILTVLLAWTWSPFALVLLLIPPFLLRDGFERRRQASEKTWGALMAREVTSPILDAMDSAKDQECQNFRARYDAPELKPVEGVG